VAALSVHVQPDMIDGAVFYNDVARVRREHHSEGGYVREVLADQLVVREMADDTSFRVFSSFAWRTGFHEGRFIDVPLEPQFSGPVLDLAKTHAGLNLIAELERRRVDTGVAAVTNGTEHTQGNDANEHAAVLPNCSSNIQM
jgi:hypothetical protein